MYKRIDFDSYHPHKSKIEIVDFKSLLNSLISTKSQDFLELKVCQRTYLYKLLDAIFRCQHVLVCPAIHAPTLTKEIDLEEEIFELVIYNVQMAASRSLVMLGHMCVDAHKNKIYLDCICYQDEIKLDSPLKYKIDTVERIHYVNEAISNLD